MIRRSLFLMSNEETISMFKRENKALNNQDLGTTSIISFGVLKLIPMCVRSLL